LLIGRGVSRLVDAPVNAAAHVLDERAEHAPVESGYHEVTIHDHMCFAHVAVPGKHKVNKGWSSSKQMIKKVIDAVLGVRQRFVDRLLPGDRRLQFLADNVLD